MDDEIDPKKINLFTLKGKRVGWISVSKGYHNPSNTLYKVYSLNGNKIGDFAELGKAKDAAEEEWFRVEDKKRKESKIFNYQVKFFVLYLAAVIICFSNIYLIPWIING